MIRIRFDWRDQWVGHYRDPDTATSYVCLLPCLVVIMRRRGR